MLLRQPDVRHEDAPAAPPEEAAPETHACASCGAPLEDGQDWCLQCGIAQPGRLGMRPGARAAATIVALTLLLCGGAVAAAYAALQDDAAREATRPAPAGGTPVAQTPQPIPAPAPAPAPTDTATTPPAPAGGDAAPPAPSDGGGSVAVPAPSPRMGAGATGSTGSTGSGSTGRGTTGSSGTGTSTGKDTSKDDGATAEPPAPKALELGADAFALYDPYGRAVDKGEPADAADGDPDTAWRATVAEDAQQMGIGLVVDLGEQRGVRALEIATDTPGFRVEIYATDTTELPPDVLDTRWAHIKDASDVGGDGDTTRIALGAGSTKYRHVLVWLTTPPDDGPAVEVSELTVLG